MRFLLDTRVLRCIRGYMYIYIYIYGRKGAFFSQRRESFTASCLLEVSTKENNHIDQVI
jgi:hypothetical protein